MNLNHEPEPALCYSKSAKLFLVYRPSWYFFSHQQSSYTISFGEI